MLSINDTCGANALDCCAQTPQSIHFLECNVVWHDDCCLRGAAQEVGLSIHSIARTRIIPTAGFVNGYI